MKKSITNKERAKEIKTVSAGTWFDYTLRNGKKIKMFVPSK